MRARLSDLSNSRLPQVLGECAGNLPAISSYVKSDVPPVRAINDQLYALLRNVKLASELGKLAASASVASAHTENFLSGKFGLALQLTRNVRRLWQSTLGPSISDIVTVSAKIKVPWILTWAIVACVAYQQSFGNTAFPIGQNVGHSVRVFVPAIDVNATVALNGSGLPFPTVVLPLDFNFLPVTLNPTLCIQDRVEMYMRGRIGSNT